MKSKIKYPIFGISLTVLLFIASSFMNPPSVKTRAKSKEETTRRDGYFNLYLSNNVGSEVICDIFYSKPMHKDGVPFMEIQMPSDQVTNSPDIPSDATYDILIQQVPVNGSVTDYMGITPVQNSQGWWLYNVTLPSGADPGIYVQ